MTPNVINEVEFEIELEVVKGFIESVRVSGEVGQNTQETHSLVDAVQGLEFGPKLPQEFYNRITLDDNHAKMFFTGCVFDMVSKFT